MRKLWTAVLGAYVGLQGASLTRADQPAAAPRKLDLPTRSSQQIADAVAETLRSNPRLRYWRVQVEVAEGVAQLSGVVANPSQHDEVVRTVQTVPGVVSVVDRIRVMGGVVPVQGTLLAQGPELKKVPLLEGLPGSGEPPLGKFPTTPGIGEGPPAGPIGPPPNGAPYGGIQEPTPIFQAPAGMPNPALQPPPMPPYAWPSYAPYNNYSRVAYPTLYPYEQFPFIGPFYPYPKVPTGWRAVTLRWQDGYWWYGKDVSGHDWWRIRHW